jgi:hypothetical protein
MREEQSIPVNNNQLLVTLAKMIAQVGNFDKRSRKDGFGFGEMVDG